MRLVLGIGGGGPLTPYRSSATIQSFARSVRSGTCFERGLQPGPLQLSGKRPSAIFASLGSMKREDLKRRHSSAIDATPLQINLRVSQQPNRALPVVSGEKLLHE